MWEYQVRRHEESGKHKEKMALLIASRRCLCKEPPPKAKRQNLMTTFLRQNLMTTFLSSGDNHYIDVSTGTASWANEFVAGAAGAPDLTSGPVNADSVLLSNAGNRSCACAPPALLKKFTSLHVTRNSLPRGRETSPCHSLWHRYKRIRFTK